jgi:ATP-binding cassette, subfamily B, multidrug efflux pump
MSEQNKNQRNVKDRKQSGGGGFGGGGHFGAPVQKAKDFRGTLKRLIRYLKPHTINLIIVLVFAIASTSFTIAAPKIMGKAMNKLQDGYMAKMMLHKMSDAQKKLVDQINLQMSQMQKSPNAEGALPQDQTKVNPETAKVIQEFMKLPMLNTVKDADQKADIVQKMLDLSKKMPSKDQSGAKNVSLTKKQINGTLRAIRETNGEYDFHYIGNIALALLGMYVISACFSLIMGLVMSGVSQKTVRDLRREVDQKLARLPLKYFDSHPHGDILSRVTNDLDTVANTLQQSLTQIITSVITIIGYIIMMLTISPILTLIMLATLPLYVVSTALIAKKSQKYFASQQKELGDLSGHVEEMYTGHKIVKAFGQEKNSIERFEGINKNLYSAGWKAQFISGMMFPLMNFVSNLGYVGISIVGGIWITKNILGLGDILAFIQYSRSFTMPIAQTAQIANVIQSTVACAERVFEILDEPEEIPDSPDAKVIEFPKGEVRFEHVDFRYKEEVPLIEDMNLDVLPGHTIAIVGPTGAGKTTLVNLLMRFYEINAGKISIDKVDIRNIKRNELRKMFGMVLQDTWLFNGTIKDNIAYAKQGATMEEIVRAAKAAHADHFIRTLPEGYDTVLNEEATNISQGQKQLITIARAILADPAILILDEATSSVDTRTEVLIQKAMSNLMAARTSFVIAHRLSTIREAELILVMNKGTIIEMGNHKDLIAKGGFYADLYNSQFTGQSLDEGII